MFFHQFALCVCVCACVCVPSITSNKSCLDKKRIVGQFKLHSSNSAYSSNTLYVHKGGNLVLLSSRLSFDQQDYIRLLLQFWISLLKYSSLTLVISRRHWRATLVAQADSWMIKVYPYYLAYLGYCWHSLWKDVKRVGASEEATSMQMMFLFHHVLTIFLVALSIQSSETTKAPIFMVGVTIIVQLLFFHVIVLCFRTHS